MDIDVLGKAAEATKVVAYGVKADQFGARTPCSEFDVRALLGHLIDVAGMSQRAAVKAEPRDVPFHGDDPAEEFGRRIDKAVHDWRRPEALRGTTTMGVPDLPAEMAATMTLTDLVIHGWDLARATDQPYECPPEVAEPVRAFIERMAPTGRGYGIFAAEVDVPADATPLDRALALSGRNPDWTG
jgi:uncharacterized protein (TIGR03086 family)